MIAITTSNSIKVNPRLGRFRGMDTLLIVDGWWPTTRRGRRVDRSGFLGMLVSDGRRVLAG